MTLGFTRNLPYFLLAAVLTAAPTFAQLNGDNLRGDTGLNSGSQAPPGVYLIGVFYDYNADRLKTGSGAPFPVNSSLDQFFGGADLFVVTSKKILGANYGFQVLFPFANIAVDSARLGQTGNAGYTDMYVQPINLGWHTKRADFIAGYAFFAPTGRYTPGANNNTGLGMWANELSAGTTLFLDKKKAWNLATTGYYEFHNDKRGTQTKPGQILTLEGGLGHSFLHGLANVGAAYVAQWKVTRDQGPTDLDLNLIGKNRNAGIGPEGSFPIASKAKGRLYAVVTARYLWEFDARSSTEGNIFFLSVTIPLTQPKH